MIDVSYEIVNNYADCFLSKLHLFSPQASWNVFSPGLFLMIGPLCRLDHVDQVLCVKADRVPLSGPVRTIAEGH